MRKLATTAEVEATIGKPSSMVMLKTTDTLDDGCRSVLAHARLAGFGFRDGDGISRTTFVGDVRVDSPTRLSFDAPASPSPPAGSGASMVFLLPGVGETLRLNGFVGNAEGGRVAVDVAESWVHCARCVLRSKLWSETPRAVAAPRSMRAFLSSATFAVVSTWDADGHGDTSPKGDPPGFIRVLDDDTVAIPDRRGNKRADTFRNLVSCDDISLAALIPGVDEVLHLSGAAYATDDAALLSTMAVKDKPPHAALVIRVERAEINRNHAVSESGMWDRSADPSDAPDLMKVAAAHLARNSGTATRMLAKGFAASPKLARRAIDASYRKELRDEGY
ncbi:pyridoxamine 5'-phosphate oxidase family protein [Kibdelosporangium persicum]|uniref:Oxidoreductase n=1 Tax=Kibdelosporangium persicum TaxID=2698649 RepID=A0ABX2F7D4_9PSEU|nr:pyridoxamine 5'-phosphate oxidase family protein [Kibdelosporangium persicum]NRN67269.1 Oxidoreductase [Kibdelosporangium persicum]